MVAAKLESVKLETGKQIASHVVVGLAATTTTDALPAVATSCLLLRRATMLKTQAAPVGREKRVGRPLARARRSRIVKIRMSDAEYATIKIRAGSMAVAAYLRVSGLDHRREMSRTIPAINAQAWRDLARTFANLNQAITSINSGKIPDDLRHIVRQTMAAVTKLRADLIGVEKEWERDK